MNDEESAANGLTRGARDDVGIVARGGAVQIVGQIAQRGLSWLFGASVVAILGTSAYGLYRKILQILAIGGQIGLAGFNYSAMRFIARARAGGNHGGVLGAARVGIGGALVGSLVVFAALMVGAGELATLFASDAEKQAEFARLTRMGAAYVPLFALMQVLRYCTQAYKTMVPSVIAGNIVQPIARSAIGVTVLLVGFEVAGAVTTLVASMALGAVAAGIFFARMLTADERKASPSARVWEMVRFALPQGGSSILGIQGLGLGILVIGITVDSDRIAGLFAIGLALQGPGTTFLGGIVNIWAPVVADLYERGEIARLQSMYQTITRWVATFSFPVFAALIIEPDLFTTLYGGAPDDAAPVAAVLAVGNLFYAGTGPTGYVISMTGHPGVNLANSVVALAAYVGFGVWVVPEHGALGMAVVDAIVTAVINTARVIQAKVLLGVQPFGRTFFKPVAGTLVGAVALLLWKLVPGESFWLDAAGLTLAAGIYLAVLRALGIDEEERYVYDRIRARIRRR